MPSREEIISNLRDFPDIKLLEYTECDITYSLIFHPTDGIFVVHTSDWSDRLAAISLSSFLNTSCKSANLLMLPIENFRKMWDSTKEAEFYDRLPLGTFILSEDFLY